MSSLRFGTVARSLQKRSLSSSFWGNNVLGSRNHVLMNRANPVGSSVYRSTARRDFSKELPKEKVVEAQKKTLLQKFLDPKVMPDKGTFAWYREMVIICTVFAITGTSTMVLVRPAMSEVLGLKGSLKDGPWSYRIGSLVIMTPLYSMLLVVVGTVFGRHAYFRHFSVKMFTRFGIPPELMDRKFHETAKTFRKW